MSSNAIAGVELGDPQLGAATETALARVEELLHREVHSDYRFVTETSLHLIDAGGKRFRPLFTLLGAHVGPTPEADEVFTAAAVVELVHLATLYHDDVMDSATMRRGAESANSRWDNTVAILTGDFLFAHASRLVADLGPRPCGSSPRRSPSSSRGRCARPVGRALTRTRCSTTSRSSRRRPAR